MARQVGGKVFINTGEVKDQLGWSRDTLYRFYRRGLVKPKKFLGDRKSYWEAEALEILKSTVINTTESFTANPAESEASNLSVGPIGNSYFGGEGNLAENLSSQNYKIKSSNRDGFTWNDESNIPTNKAKFFENSAKSNDSTQLVVRVDSLGLDISEQEDFTDTMMANWKRELPGLDEELFGLFGRLQRAGRIFDKDVERAMNQYGLKVSEFLVLGALRRIGPPYCLTPTELFKSLLITSGAITKRIDRLEQRHLVERLPDPSDRRGTLVRLTPLGEETVNNAVASPGEEQYHWLTEVLTPVERKVLVNLLRKLLINRERQNEQ